MDIKDLYKDVISLSKEATIAENLRFERLTKDVVTASSNLVSNKLSKYYSNISLSDVSCDLTEYVRNTLSGKVSATLNVDSIGGKKCVPVTFVVKASVPTMVETPELLKAELDNVKGSLDEEIEEILKRQDEKVKNSDEEEKINNLVESGLNKGISKEALYNNFVLGLKKEAKKEIDLGLRENVFSSTFPVKILVYPKTYLPKLKKGDIINIGGLKYKYIGDEPLLNGSTDDGINARFELISNNKKASLSVTAEEKRPYATLDDSDIESQLLYFFENPKDKTGLKDDYIKELEYRPNVAAWYAGLFSSIKDGLDQLSPKTRENLLANSGSIVSLIGGFYNSDSSVDFNKLPKEVQDAILKDDMTTLKVLKKFPSMLDKNLAESLSKNVELATDLVNSGVKFKNTEAINTLKEVAMDDVGYSPIKDEDLPYGGSFDSDFNYDDKYYRKETEDTEDIDYTNSDKNFDNEVGTEDVKDEDSLKEEINKEIDKEKSQEDIDNESIEVDEHGNEVKPVDYLEKEKDVKMVEDWSKQDEESKKKKDENNQNTENKQDSNTEATKKDDSIEKESAMDDLTFETKLEDLDNEGFLEDNIDLVEKIKELKPELKNVPKEWISISETKLSGYLKWRVMLDARDWGISQLSVIGDEANFDINVDFGYYKNAESADMDELEYDSVSFNNKITEITCELGDNMDISRGFQLTPKSYEIKDPDFMVVKF